MDDIGSGLDKIGSQIVHENLLPSSCRCTGSHGAYSVQNLSSFVLKHDYAQTTLSKADKHGMGIGNSSHSSILPWIVCPSVQE